MGEHIAVLVDEGDHDSPHVEHAVELASERDATLHAIYVIDSWRFGEYSVYGWEELALETHRQKGEATLTAIRETCEARDVDFAPETTVGKPADVLHEYARRHDIDVLVCGEPDGSGDQVGSPSMLDRIRTDMPADVTVV